MDRPISHNRLPWVVAVLAVLAIILTPLPSLPAAPSERVIRVEASSFAYTPSTIRVNPGDHVTLEVVADDVVHGIYVDGYNVQVSADPGQTARLSFVADRRGAFRLRCSVTCGPLHPFMIGKLYVGPNPLFFKAAAAALVFAFIGIWTLRK